MKANHLLLAMCLQVRIVEANISVVSPSGGEVWQQLPDGTYTVEVQVGDFDQGQENSPEGLKMIKLVRVIRGCWNNVEFHFPHRPFLPKLILGIFCVLNRDHFNSLRRPNALWFL